MKYCPKCGAECEDSAVFCSVCGEKLPESGYRPNSAFEEKPTSNSTGNYESNPDQARTLGILSLVFGIIGINIVGIICGAVGLAKNPDSGSKSLCIVGLAISIIHMVIQLIIWILAATGIIEGFFFI